MSDKNLFGKTVLLTGASGGLGCAMLEAFASAGANIFAHARHTTPEFESKCRRVSQLTGSVVSPVYFDMCDEVAIKRAIHEIIVDKKMQIDILVNNAGVMQERLIHMMSTSDMRKQFEVNFFAPILLMQMVSKAMMRKSAGGVIINMSSRSAFDGIVGGAVYGATKAAIAAASRSLAKELGRYKIRVNCIAPGVIETPMTASLSEQVKELQKGATYVGRLGVPEDVAGVAVFLASDAARYITGQVIRVDGGLN